MEKILSKRNKKNFDLAHEKTRDLINCGINPFSYYVNNKKNDRLWKNDIINFERYLTKVSPDFKMLWYISEFITTLELLYMYHNVENAPLYNIILKKKDIKSFRVNFEDFYIEYTLYDEDMTISCKIVRSWNKAATSEISFRDGECIMDTRADEILMFTMIDLTMQRVHDIFVEAYDKAKIIQSNLYKQNKPQ